VRLFAHECVLAIMLGVSFSIIVFLSFHGDGLYAFCKIAENNFEGPMVSIICEQHRPIHSLSSLLYYLITTFLCSLPVYKLMVFYTLCSSSFPFIGNLCEC
jgi:hypothetical protein